jgi:hypothetical protein
MERRFWSAHKDLVCNVVKEDQKVEEMENVQSKLKHT